MDHWLDGRKACSHCSYNCFEVDFYKIIYAIEICTAKTFELSKEIIELLFKRATRKKGLDKKQSTDKRMALHEKKQANHDKRPRCGN